MVRSTVEFAVTSASGAGILLAVFNIQRGIYGI